MPWFIIVASENEFARTLAVMQTPCTDAADARSAADRLAVDDPEINVVAIIEAEDSGTALCGFHEGRGQ